LSSFFTKILLFLLFLSVMLGECFYRRQAYVLCIDFCICGKEYLLKKSPWRNQIEHGLPVESVFCNHFDEKEVSFGIWCVFVFLSNVWNILYCFWNSFTQIKA
jgi:hypothetical protein